MCAGSAPADEGQREADVRSVVFVVEPLRQVNVCMNSVAQHHVGESHRTSVEVLEYLSNLAPTRGGERDCGTFFRHAVGREAGRTFLLVEAQADDRSEIGPRFIHLLTNEPQDEQAHPFELDQFVYRK